MENTIEERAVAFKKHPINHVNGFAWETGYREGCHIGYYRGATDQLKADKERVYHALDKIVSKEVLEELMRIMEE